MGSNSLIWRRNWIFVPKIRFLRLIVNFPILPKSLGLNFRAKNQGLSALFMMSFSYFPKTNKVWIFAPKIKIYRIFGDFSYNAKIYMVWIFAPKLKIYQICVKIWCVYLLTRWFLDAKICSWCIALHIFVTNGRSPVDLRLTTTNDETTTTTTGDNWFSSAHATATVSKVQFSVICWTRVPRQIISMREP